MDLDLGSNGSECEVVGWSRKAPQTTQARSNMEKVTHTQRVMLLMMVMMSVQEEAGGRVDRQLVRMGYRFLVRGCKFL